MCTEYLDSSSGYGVGEEGAEDREYCVSSYYSEENKSHKIHKIHFIFWNTKVHQKVCIPVYSLLNEYQHNYLRNCGHIHRDFFPLKYKLSTYNMHGMMFPRVLTHAVE